MGANLITYGSFEVDTNSDGVADGLNLTANTTVNLAYALSTSAKYGTKAQQFSVEANAGNTGKLYTVQFDLTAVGTAAAGQTATFSVWVNKASGSGTFGTWTPSLIAYHSNGSSALGTQNGTGVTSMASGWTRYSVTYANLPVNTSRLKAQWQHSGIVATTAWVMLFDGAKIELGAAPSAFAGVPARGLLATGVL